MPKQEAYVHTALKLEMRGQGISEEEMAKKMGISRQGLDRKLNGKRAFNDVEMRKIVDILKITQATKIVHLFFEP